MVSAKSLAGLTKWLHREEWQYLFDEVLELHLAPACAKADVSVDELLDLVGDRYGGMLWGCVFEDFLTQELADGRNIVDEYLKRRGWKESASNRAYIAALRSTVMSLYEISDIVPEESFLARDLVRGGEPVRVSEQVGTRYLRPWDRIAARIVWLGSRAEMAGGVLSFDHTMSEALLKALDPAGERAGAEVGQTSGLALPTDAPTATELLRASAFLFTNVWLDHLLQQLLNPKLPRLQNTDGEEIEFTKVTYPLSLQTNTDAISRALDSLPSLRRADEGFWNWVETRKSAATKQDAEAPVIITKLDDGSIVLGTIELKRKSLLLEANSRERAERGRALIEPVLDGLVGKPKVDVQSVEQMMASKPTNETKKKISSSRLTPDEQRAITHAFLDEHYREIIDQPVPMLGNVSPREASKTAQGREKLVAWLKFMENSAARHEPDDPMAGYDLAWLWQALDVGDLRR